MECVASITVFTFKSSTTSHSHSAEQLQARSDAQRETIRSDLFSYQLYHLLPGSIHFGVSISSH